MTTDFEKRILQRAVWGAAGYTPNEGQIPFHASDKLLKLVAGGVRAGKSRSTAMEFAGELAIKDGLLWIIGPDYEQAKAEFEYLYTALYQMGFVAKSSRPEKGSRSMVLANGCRIQTKSSDDKDSLASFAPHAILMVEAGQQEWLVYEKCQERALEHNAKVILSGTFEGSLSWYAEKYEKWQRPNPEDAVSFSMPSWTNTKIFPLGRQDPKILRLEASMPADLFAERVGAVPFKPQSLIFKSGPQHIDKFDFNPDWQIELAVDPATHTYAVEVLQFQGPKVRVIDEIYLHDTIAQDVIPIVMARPWWKYVKENAGVMDIAGKQHQGNKSQLEIWRELAGVAFRTNYVFVQDGINQLKLRLQEQGDDSKPLIMFDYRLDASIGYDGRAKGVLGEMGLAKWHEFKEGRNESPKPIDVNLDACKALWYWLYDKHGPLVERHSRTTTRKRTGWDQLYPQAAQIYREYEAEQRASNRRSAWEQV